jgi:hypothetical protein
MVRLEDDRCSRGENAYAPCWFAGRRLDAPHLTWIFCQVMQHDRASDSTTLLRASFKIRLNGEPVIIATIGQAYRFITSLSPVEWMEYRSLHAQAKVALEAAAKNAMLNIQATQALRTLLARAGLL